MCDWIFLPKLMLICPPALAGGCGGCGRGFLVDIELMNICIKKFLKGTCTNSLNRIKIDSHVTQELNCADSSLFLVLSRFLSPFMDLMIRNICFLFLYIYINICIYTQNRYGLTQMYKYIKIAAMPVIIKLRNSKLKTKNEVRK